MNCPLFPKAAIQVLSILSVSPRGSENAVFAFVCYWQSRLYSPNVALTPQSNGLTLDCDSLADHIDTIALLLRGGGRIRLSTLSGQDHKSRNYHGADPSIVWPAYISNSRRISCTCQNYSWLLSLHWYHYSRAMDLRPRLGQVSGCLTFSRWQAQAY